MEFRKRIIDSYAYLFGTADKDEQEDANEFSEQAQFGKQWGWYQSIYSLAQGDITRFENITKLTAHECFMMLSFLKEKNDIEARQIKSKI